MTTAEARRKLAISQSEMAKLMGNTSIMTISKWETGKRTPRAQAVELAELLVWLHEHHPGVLAEWRRMRL